MINKRIISLFTVMLLCFGIVSPIRVLTYTDADDSLYIKEINTLSSLGILNGYEDGTFQPQKKVTRAEFVSMVVRSLDLGNIDVSINSYDDIEDTYWARNAIAIATHLGYVNGSTDNRFYPDDNITFEQAAKVLVCIVNYRELAEDAGGYPVGYLIAAGNKKILQGVNVPAGKPLTREQVAKLIYNAMDVKRYDPNAQKEGKSLFDLFYATKEFRGVVTATKVTGLKSSSGTSGNDKVQITVDGNPIALSVGNTNAYDYFGYQVRFMAVEDVDGELTLISIAPEGSKNSVYEINPQLIRSLDLKEKIDYYEDEDSKRSNTINFDGNTSFIYNGVYDGMLSENEFDTDCEIKIIDNNSDGVADVLFLSRYYNLVVSSYLVEDDIKKVYFKSRQNVPISDIELNPRDKKTYTKVLFNNELLTDKQINELDIAESTVASVQISKDEKSVLVSFSDKIVDGRVDEISVDDKAATYRINGVPYTAARDFTEDIKIGESYVFLISFNNKIVEINTDIKAFSKNYALFVDGAIKTKGVRNNAQFKLILRNGKTVVYETADKVKVNNSTPRAITQLDISNIGARRVIVYTLDSNNKISKYETADEKDACLIPAGYIGYGKESKFTLNASTSLYFKLASVPTFGGDMKVDKNTIVFDVSSPDSEEWGVGDYTILQNETYYTIDAYDNDKFKTATVIVNHGTRDLQKSTVPWGQSIMLIERISQKLDDDGMPAYVVTGYQNSKLSQLVLKDENVSDYEKANKLVEMTPGSVVQLQTNIAGKVTSFRRLYKAPTDTEVFEKMGSNNWQGSDYSVNLHTAYAMCKDVSGSVMTVATTMDDKIRSYSTSNAIYYYYDAKTKKAGMSSYKDARPISSYGANDCSRVFLRMEKDDVKEVIIYR